MFSSSQDYIEAMYQLYLSGSPDLLPDWRAWFDTYYPLTKIQETPSVSSFESFRNFCRQNGHYFAKLDPLALAQGEIPSAIQQQWQDYQSLPEFPDFAQKYAHTVAYEFMHLEDPTLINWWIEKIEQRSYEPSLQQRKQFWELLHRCVGIELFLKKRFASVKRFGLEGGESFIVGLEALLYSLAEDDLQEVIIGMAHRGRLNLMLNLMNMPLTQFLGFFQHSEKRLKRNPNEAGDVKYHLGYESARQIAGRDIKLRLMANPSHLESVDAIAMGFAAARQQSLASQSKVLPLIIHGDAAFVGQGVVAECLNMSGLAGYNVGGVVHVILNNQIGFTANTKEGRSCRYASDMAKAWQIPIIHVNADDVEAVAQSFELAAQYRKTFQKDVLIDFVCYRRMGHNEIDEPSYTQPLVYKTIQDHPHVEEIYKAALLAEGALRESDVKEAEVSLQQSYEEALKSTENLTLKSLESQPVVLETLREQELYRFVERLTKAPEGFHLHPKLERQLHQKSEGVAQQRMIDWALAESLAMATLVQQGVRVRLAGQDSGRGTFSQRHARWVDYETGATYIPLQSWGSERFQVIDSFLSEYAAMGFEYGFSLEQIPQLVMWEAQFGDFANGAQIIIDQYIASALTKWKQTSSLVLLLPHGMEGQGSEHSSARLERFLQLCVHENMTVVNCTTPANYFHILRKQVSDNFARPLVIMTPKSLLRHPEVLSSVDDLCGESKFEPVLVSAPQGKPESVRRLVLCSGKIYYDLLAWQRDHDIDDVVIIRMEQIYPLPEQELQMLLRTYKKAEVLWCQEEPENMGAGPYLERALAPLLSSRKHKQDWPMIVARAASSAPATGYADVHIREQEMLVKQAFAKR